MINSTSLSPLPNVCFTVAETFKTEICYKMLVEIPVVQTVSSIIVPCCITVTNRDPDNQYL